MSHSQCTWCSFAKSHRFSIQLMLNWIGFLFPAAPSWFEKKSGNSITKNCSVIVRSDSDVAIPQDKPDIVLLTFAMTSGWSFQKHAIKERGYSR